MSRLWSGDAAYRLIHELIGNTESNTSNAGWVLRYTFQLCVKTRDLFFHFTDRWYNSEFQVRISTWEFWKLSFLHHFGTHRKLKFQRNFKDLETSFLTQQIRGGGGIVSPLFPSGCYETQANHWPFETPSKSHDNFEITTI